MRRPRGVPEDRDAFAAGILVGVAGLCAVLWLYEIARRLL